jgi:hypothetical protein
MASMAALISSRYSSMSMVPEGGWSVYHGFDGVD